MSAKRYDFERGKSESGCTCKMVQANAWGEYVEYDDYAALEAELAAVKRERDEARARCERLDKCKETAKRLAKFSIRHGNDPKHGRECNCAWSDNCSCGLEQARADFNAALAECGEGKP